MFMRLALLERHLGEVGVGEGLVGHVAHSTLARRVTVRQCCMGRINDRVLVDTGEETSQDTDR